MTPGENCESFTLPTEATVNQVLKIFLNTGYIPADSELMESISPPRKFPIDREGDLFLKKKIFREADSNSEGPLAALVRTLFETTVFPNMVRTGHWLTGDNHKKKWYINLVADITVSRLIRLVLFGILMSGDSEFDFRHILLVHDAKTSGSSQEKKYLFREHLSS